MNGQTRLNINVNTQTEMAIRTYSEKHKVTVTEAVRRLVGMAHFVNEAIEDGKDVLFRQGSLVETVRFTL